MSIYLFSLLFFSVCIVLLASGIQLLLSNSKNSANRCYFSLVIALNFWSAGLALATSAQNVEICTLWRRISALGWGSAYAILFHLILIMTGKTPQRIKWLAYFVLYLPALLTIFAFAIPNQINPAPYELIQTEFGWVNVGKDNIWDWIFYAYYVSYILIGLILLFLWGNNAKDFTIKRNSRTVFLSVLFGIILGSFTDVFLSSFFSRLPQMAPVIMLIPILSIYHVLKKNMLKENEQVTRKSSYANMIFSVTLYMMISFYQYHLSNINFSLGSIQLQESTIRGIITQFQMLLSIYLVIRENKPGYLASFLMNSVVLFSSVAFLIRTKSNASLPGIISNIGVLLIISLINNYKNHTAANIQRINKQNKSLEESEKKLYKMAYYDSLTGLPNRDWFIDQLNQSIIVAKRNSYLIGIMFIDFDSFKTVNDTAGHTTGDIVLNKLAGLLSSCLREGDTIARFGGDEFLIQFTNIEKVEGLYATANRIMDAIKKPVVVEEAEYFVSASIGVAVYPIDGNDSETLIKNADIAMYLAKNKGKNQCIFCTSDIKENITKKMKLTNSLYRALDRNELFLYYQPQVDTQTQDIIGFEALLRWNQRDYGMISPVTFIPIAEQTGLIRPIGFWVFRTACQQIKAFQEFCKKELTISINLSVQQLKDPHILDEIKNIIDETQTDVRYIQIEITESMAFNDEPYLLQRLHAIKGLGISVSIDDFGTGHSSLSRLKSFPIDLIKIDIEFVRGISSKSNKDKAIIKSMIQIAKNLGVAVLAEGVETEDQYLYLKESGCDSIQGYYFYKPMPPDDIQAILKEKNIEE